MEKINITELLKDCPKGMELDCTMYDDVTFHHIFDGGVYPIKIKTPDGVVGLDEYGCYSNNKHAKCVIFPKGKTTWEGFVPPYKFKNGDIIYIKDKHNKEWCAILSNCEDDKLYIYIDFCISSNTFYPNKPNVLYEHKYIIEYRLATEEEKQKLFDAIKANGYKWNAETKTLKKLPKFKVGDRVKHISTYKSGVVVKVSDEGYYINYPKSEGICHISFELEKDYELAPNKFDITTLVPFESKVLIRDNNQEKWFPAIWGFYDEDYTEYPYKLVGCISRFCIPYEGNKHLLGKTNDCDEYYKTWE